MPKKKSTAQKQAERRRQEAQKRQMRQALRYFRPRKSDYGKFIFVSAYPKVERGRVVERAGTRLPKNSRRKGYLVYVTRPSKVHPRGRYRVLRDIEKKGTTKPPVPRKISDLNLFDHGKPKAARAWYGGRLDAGRAGTIKRKPGQHTLDFMRDIVPKVARTLKREVDSHRSRRAFVCECAATVQYSDGQKRTVVFEIDFKQAEMWIQPKMPLSFYKPFIEKKLYAFMAEHLSDWGLVSQGSARYVKNLSENKGVPRSHWTKHGRYWGKNDFDEVKIARFDFIPKHVTIS